MIKKYNFLAYYFNTYWFTPVEIWLSKDHLEVFVPERDEPILSCESEDFSKMQYISVSHFGGTDCEYFLDCPCEIDS
uniref:Uncharacterized protein n=1 Tax=Megaselia scalaris TaxID=36166 RepID=T1GXX7_MEGSC